MSQSAWQTPTSPYHPRWDEREQYYTKEDPRSRQHFYPTPPPSARSFPSSTAPRLPARPRRPQWPPSPFAEEEANSISREHTPVLLKEDDVPLRGSRDQNPVILEADASSDDDSNKLWRSKNGRLDSSSSESSGPKTPTEGSQNDERRFIFVPTHQEHNESDGEDHGRRGSYVRVRDGHSPTPSTRSKSPARPGLSIDPKGRKEKDALPYTGPREATPYTFTPGSAKNKPPEEFLLSPEPMTPNRNFSAAQAHLRGRQNDLKREKGDLHRTLSSSYTVTSQRSAAPRHLSAMGTPGECARSSSHEPATRTAPDIPQSVRDKRREVSPFRDLKDSEVFDSESGSESDVSPDEMSPPRRRRRNTRYSMTASDLSQGSAGGNKESVRRARPEPINTGPMRAHLPSRQESLPTPQDHAPKTHSPAKPGGPSPEMQQKRSIPLTRPDTINGSSHTPMTPSREPLRSFFASPPSSSNSTRPGSRPGSPGGSKPNSRSSTPDLHPHPVRHSTLDIPLEHKQHQSPSGPNLSNRPPSRPSTPSFAPRVPSKLEAQARPSEDTRRPGAPQSRHTSPLPSPNPDKGHFEDNKSTGQGQPTEDRSRTFPQEGRPIHSRESSIVQPRPMATTNNKLFAEPAEVPGRRSLESHSTRSSVEVTRSPTMTFKPTLRRHPASRIPTLPACPRPHLVGGYDDWSTLPGHPNFDVCPSCRDALEDGGFENQFITSPRRADNYSTRCDLSVTWVRMAWLLLLQDRARDRNIVKNMTTILAHEPICPGRQLTPRTWHRLFDPELNRYVANFDVCPACLKSLEQLFPNLQGAFHAMPYPPAANARTCDLRTDSHRFARYVDLLENISTQAADHRREPNMHRFIQLATRFGSMRECHKDDQLHGTPWHFPPHIPDITVCEECYAEIVWPMVKTGKEAAGMFNRTLQMPPKPQAQMGLSCQLYSERMRGVFRDAVQRGDVRSFIEKVLARVSKERELQRKHREIQSWKDEDGRIEEGRRLVREWARWA